MIETQLNMFDLVVASIMLLSALFAFFRGFVKEILSLGAWIGAGLVTVYYFPSVAAKLQPHFKSPVVAAGFGTLGLYITALMLFSFVNMLILKFVKSGSDVGFLDNSLGLLFGVARGAFIISLGYLLMTTVLTEEEYPEWLKKSKTRPVVEQGALLLASAAPDYMKEITSLRDKMEEQEEQDAKSKHSLKSGEEKTIKKNNDFLDSEEEGAPVIHREQGYSTKTRAEMDRLLDRVNTPDN